MNISKKLKILKLLVLIIANLKELRTIIPDRHYTHLRIIYENLEKIKKFYEST